jgi:solute:Na+ symporter, SSS family
MHLTISAVDLVVIGVYMAAVVLLGVWAGRGNRDLSDYLLGSRNLPWWALLGSIVATETSTATFLSVPGLAYDEGGDLQFLQLAFGYILGRILVAKFLLPAYFAGQMYTAYEVLHKRFGTLTQRFASLLFLVTRNLGDGLRLLLTAWALEAATGMSLVACVLVIAAVTIFYTLIGGMKSVVWNDCLQLVIFIVGGVVTLWLLIRGLPGGWEQLQSFAADHDKWRVFDFAWKADDALTFWAGLFGGMFLSIGTHGTDQMFVQRLLSARNQREAARALITSGVVVLLQFALFLMIGVGLAAFFAQYPPSPPIAKGDTAYARYIVEQMPVGLAGLALAAVFAAAMSTLSSSLNSSAAALISDFGFAPQASPRRQSGDTFAAGGRVGSEANGPADAASREIEVVADPGETSDARQMRRVRWLTVMFGGIQAALAIGAANLSTSIVMDALAIAGFTAGTLLGVFALGTFTKRAGETAAVGGMLVGLLVLTFVKFLTKENDAGETVAVIAWPWYAIIGGATTFGVGALIGHFAPLSPKTASAPQQTQSGERGRG